MNLSMLLEDALAERGNAVVVIAHPSEGENAVILAANGPFARIVGWQADRVSGARLGELRRLVEHPDNWDALIQAVRTLSSLALDLKLRVNNREVVLGFSLTFRRTPGEVAGHGVLIGRDITETRERAARDADSQRMLASVFLRISAAVAVVGADGAILMANPACQQLLGYDAMELAGRDVETLTPPEYAEAARAARARQLADGGNYVMRMQTFTKSGVRVSVTLHSALLRDARDRRLRVVTLVPDPAQGNRGRTDMYPEPNDIGQVQAISLAALRNAYGAAWPRIADRVTMQAEQIIKRRLGPADVFSRRNDDCFMIWFESADEARNQAVLARTTREIRLRFLTEGGKDVPDHTHAVSIGVEAISPSSLARSPVMYSKAGPGQPARERDHDARDARGLWRELHANPVADVRPVTGRDGKRRPIVMVDFALDVRRRVDDLVPTLPHEPDQGTGLDVIRLDLAIRELAIRREEEISAVVPISWSALTEPACRPLLDERVARMPPDSRSYLMLAVSGVRLLTDASLWADTVGLLQRRIGEVGLLLTRHDVGLEQIREAIIGAWPISLLIIDVSTGPPVKTNAYLDLIETARRRDVAVLVRTEAADVRDWRDLGATMYVAG